MNNKLKKEAIVQFSGGIDSLYTAYLLGQKYDKIHLLTFYKGYLHFGLNFSKPNIDNLKKILGNENVISKVIDMKGLFKKMTVKDFFKNSKKYGNETSWCIPCRASMAIMSIIYALENNIPDYTDGANWEQAPDQENLLVTADNFPGYLNLIKELSNLYKVNYFSPVYKLNTREERRELLLDLGFKIDWNSLDVDKPKSLTNIFNRDFYKRYQPMCISGWLIHWKRNFLNKKVNTSEEQVLGFIKPKLDLFGKNYIETHFKDRGKNLKEILNKRNQFK